MNTLNSECHNNAFDRIVMTNINPWFHCSVALHTVQYQNKGQSNPLALQEQRGELSMFSIGVELLIIFDFLLSREHKYSLAFSSKICIL